MGQELGLFALMDEGPGFPFFLPKGMVLKNLLIDYWRKIHAREGYVEISTPMMLNRQLWETSGHWDHYRENMYTTVIDDTDFAIKPMNCPQDRQTVSEAMRNGNLRHEHCEMPSVVWICPIELMKVMAHFMAPSWIFI